MSDTEKSLSEWRAQIKLHGRSGWQSYYMTLLGAPISNISRFFRTVKLYGDFAVFDAILATSTAAIDGDPLNYVCKVASNLWKQAEEKDDAVQKELDAVESVKKISQKKNDELARKMKKAQKKKDVKLEE